MRGKDVKQPFLDFLNGITPAYAGKRVGKVYRVGSSGDHPRLCGEKFCNDQI